MSDNPIIKEMQLEIRIEDMVHQFRLEELKTEEEKDMENMRYIKALNNIENIYSDKLKTARELQKEPEELEL